MRIVATQLLLCALAYSQSNSEILSRLTAQNSSKLDDYKAFYSAGASFEANDDKAAVEDLKPIWAHTPKSPFVGRAVLLAAKAYTRSGNPKLAITTLRNFNSDTPQPDGDIAMAAAFEAAQDNVSAARYYQRVFYGYPNSSAAAQAETALSGLHTLLGASFPTPTPQAMLGRAQRLLDAGKYLPARLELQALIPSLSPLERDVANIRIGQTYYNARDNSTAFNYFRNLSVASPDLDAERLFWELQSARRLNKLDEISAALEKFARQYPTSKWRAEGLNAIGEHYALTNQPAQYEPLFRTCYEAFPASPQAPMCHWRVAFAEYLQRDPTAVDLLKEQAKLYPKSDKAPAALYFLGRLAEESQNPAGARTYYQEIDRLYPNFYYAVLARERLGAIGRAPSSTKDSDFTPNSAAQLRIDRANLLSAAGLDDLAEGELRFGAASGDQPAVLAVALAKLSLKRDMPERAVRYIKRFAPGYLYQPLDSLPIEFWKLAFPLPYREPLERFSKLEGLDPFLVAALVRQESEFDRNVVSHAHAYGLAQVLPSTGRELATRAGIRKFTADMLFRAELNLQLGTRYLKSLLTQMDNRIEATLAAYNAGKTRSVMWLGWHQYREPAEFVESIPFSETRNYVQVVLRNADIYRRLYGDTLSKPATAAIVSAPPVTKQ
jgi:soluble lytic murein transglycosylase